MNEFTAVPFPATDEAQRQDQVKALRRILVVDDEISIREFIAEMLVDFDYEVETAGSAAGALEKLLTTDFDALLTDYHMPKGTGKDLVLQMRSEGIHIPTIMMTGQTKDLLIRHPDLQVNALLEKPFLIQELLDVLANVLESEIPSEGTYQLRSEGGTPAVPFC